MGQLSRAEKPAPDPRLRQFLTWFQAEYKTRRHGADYLVNWPRDMSLVKKMLGATSYERLQKLAVVLLEADADRFINESDRGIGMLSVKFNWLSDRLAKFEARRRQGDAR